MTMHVFRQLPVLLVSAASRSALQIARQQQHSSLAAAAPAAQKVSIGAKYLFGIGAATWASQSDSLAEHARLAYLIPTRLLRDVITALSVVVDYKTALSAVPEGDGEARQLALRACHQRSADKLLKLCFDNGGIYIKLGQHIGQLHMLDKCPVSGWPEEFSPTPIASASLAQVHVATAHDGTKLAVKVQHAGLRESCAADVATIEFLVNAVRVIFPDVNYMWLVDEVKHNLPLELDFNHEMANAERCRRNLNSAKSSVAKSVHVPHVHPQLSSARVLTMEFIEGVQVTDRPGLSQLGIAPGALAQLVSQTFNEMIFIHGDVHCDPHAANLLVRKGPAGQTQLVLLDHGLYRQIDDSFRREYAALWRALIFSDKAGIKQHAESMNAGDAYPLFAAMLTMRPWDQIVDFDPQLEHLSLTSNKQEKDMLRGYASVYAKQIGDLLLRMPRPLLLLLKTNDCLRSVDLSLGAPVNTFVITAKTCSRALAEMDMQQSPGVRSWLAGRASMLRVELVMAAMRVMGLWVAAQRALGLGGAAGSRRGLGNGGVVYDEQVLEQHRRAAEAGIVLAAQAEESAQTTAATAA
ncbi:ABC1 family-domain-containing protein [Scenedesmus sp. NREL 46B-D3]|nr:ABC1 family-domain-containing protein [Scenedesmus sp. NREL 46B-D3]